MFSRHVIKELSSYIDNQLSEARKLKIEKHLKTCELCSQELARLKLLSEKLKAWLPSEPMVNFESSVRNKIVAWELERGAVKMKKKTLTILIPSGVLAGILVFLFVGQMYIRSMRQPIFGRVTESTDKLGSQFAPEANYDFAWKDSSLAKSPAVAAKMAAVQNFGGLRDQAVTQYEPYYYVNGESNLVSGAIDGNFLANASPSKTYSYVRSNEAVSGSSVSSATTYAEGPVIVIQPVLPATGEGEKIIRFADIRLEVADGKETYKQASEICQELGGYLASSNFYRDADGREAGTITMRIPKGKFLIALDKLNALGKVENSSTNSQDVSQEYANLKAQLDAEMVVYKKMLEALEKRQTTIPEAVRLESELTPVLRRIEALKNKLEYLNNAVSFTTVTLRFHEPKVSAKILKETKQDIQQSMLTAAINAVKMFASVIKAIPMIVVTLVWVAVIVGIVLLAKYWILRLFKRG